MELSVVLASQCLIALIVHVCLSLEPRCSVIRVAKF
jgi:hypothetical protein